MSRIQRAGRHDAKLPKTARGPLMPYRQTDVHHSAKSHLTPNLIIIFRVSVVSSPYISRNMTCTAQAGRHVHSIRQACSSIGSSFSMCTTNMQQSELLTCSNSSAKREYFRANALHGRHVNALHIRTATCPSNSRMQDLNSSGLCTVCTLPCCLPLALVEATLSVPGGEEEAGVGDTATALAIAADATLALHKNAV
jgi:hypothetical protein